MPNPLPSMFRMRRMMQQRLGWFGGEASDQDGWMDGGWCSTPLLPNKI